MDGAMTGYPYNGITMSVLLYAEVEIIENF